MSCAFLFQIIKDFYLLGRGELYQVFIDLAQHMLKTPPTAVTEHGTSKNLIFSFVGQKLETCKPLQMYGRIIVSLESDFLKTSNF